MRQKLGSVVLLNKKIHILLSEVYCVWRVVKTATIISNNPVLVIIAINIKTVNPYPANVQDRVSIASKRHMGFNSAFVGLNSTCKLLAFSKKYQIVSLTEMGLVLKATCFDQDMEHHHFKNIVIKRPQRMQYTNHYRGFTWEPSFCNFI